MKSTLEGYAGSRAELVIFGVADFLKVNLISEVFFILTQISLGFLPIRSFKVDFLDLNCVIFCIRIS